MKKLFFCIFAVGGLANAATLNCSHELTAMAVTAGIKNPQIAFKAADGTIYSNYETFINNETQKAFKDSEHKYRLSVDYKTLREKFDAKTKLLDDLLEKQSDSKSKKLLADLKKERHNLFLLNESHRELQQQAEVFRDACANLKDESSCSEMKKTEAQGKAYSEKYRIISDAQKKLEAALENANKAKNDIRLDKLQKETQALAVKVDELNSQVLGSNESMDVAEMRKQALGESVGIFIYPQEQEQAVRDVLNSKMQKYRDRYFRMKNQQFNAINASRHAPENTVLKGLQAKYQAEMDIAAAEIKKLTGKDPMMFSVKQFPDGSSRVQYKSNESMETVILGFDQNCKTQGIAYPFYTGYCKGREDSDLCKMGAKLESYSKMNVSEKKKSPVVRQVKPAVVVEK